MITLTMNLPNYLNTSLQVGDMIFARPTLIQSGSNDLQAGPTGIDTNWNHMVGMLVRIRALGDGVWELNINQLVVDFPYTPLLGDFIMFSKYDQSVGDVMGYYAKAKFINNSKKKAELFSVGSEVIINSK